MIGAANWGLHQEARDAYDETLQEDADDGFSGYLYKLDEA